jgi:hypothetical protein
MLRAIGSRDPKQAENQPYVQMVECACMVSDIDGVPQPLPSKEEHIDGMLDRLGDEGMAAIYVHRSAEIKRVMEEAEAAAASATPGEKPDPLAQSGSSPTTAPSETASSSSSAA